MLENSRRHYKQKEYRIPKANLKSELVGKLKIGNAKF